MLRYVCEKGCPDTGFARGCSWIDFGANDKLVVQYITVFDTYHYSSEYAMPLWNKSSPPISASDSCVALVSSDEFPRLFDMAMSER